VSQKFTFFFLNVSFEIHLLEENINVVLDKELDEESLKDLNMMQIMIKKNVPYIAIYISAMHLILME
jgi:hypothetical protein